MVAWMCQYSTTDTVLAMDACLTGCGGVCDNEFYQARFPREWVEDPNMNIAHFEMWALITGLKLWRKKLFGKYFWVHVDNEAVTTIIINNKSQLSHW